MDISKTKTIPYVGEYRFKEVFFKEDGLRCIAMCISRYKKPSLKERIIMRLRGFKWHDYK